MKDNFDIFFRRKPALMLVALKKVSKARYGSVLAKEVDCTYSHAVKILQTLEKLSLVVFEKKGRIKLIQLTKKGDEVAEAIENIQCSLLNEQRWRRKGFTRLALSRGDYPDGSIPPPRHRRHGRLCRRFFGVTTWPQWPADVPLA